MDTINFPKQIVTAIIVSFLIIGVFQSVVAQDVASGTATATVMAALQVIATSPLVFGNVYQGVAKTVDKNTVDAGIFDIVGAANADLLLYMSLPEYVATTTGDDRMIIAFGNTSCDIDTALAVQPGDPTVFIGGWQSEDPHNIMGVAGADPCLGDAGFCSIYLGGKVTPRINQTAGAYSGDIVLTAGYQGT